MKTNLIAMLAVMALTCVGARAGTMVLYDFEDLTLGSLGVQDNWLGSARVIGAPLGVGNSSTRAAAGTGGDSNQDLGSRLNDGNFAIPSFANVTMATLQFDIRLATTGVTQGTMGIGTSINNNSIIEPGDVVPGPGVGYEVNPVFGAYWISGTPHFFLVRNGGGVISADALFPAGFDRGDWIRLRLDMDLTANGGDGLASMYAQNLTTGQTDFTPILGIQNVSLNLTTSGQLPSAWNGLYIQIIGGLNNGAQIDNLFVMVPEPGTAMVLTVGAALITRRRIRHV